MIDVHCHVLPGIDDGPDSLSGSVALARAMVADGVTHAIATPHIHTERWENDCESIANAWQGLCAELENNGVPLQLRFAAELRLDADLPDRIQNNRVPFLGSWNNYRVILLEMPHGQVPAGTDKVIAWLKQRNILALLAHPERNREIMRRPGKLQPLLDQGCLVQVTAGSLLGDFGENALLIAEKLLEADLITVLASDAHNLKNRPPKLSSGFETVKAKLGHQAAWQLVHLNPDVLFTSNASANSMNTQAQVIH